MASSSGGEGPSLRRDLPLPGQVVHYDYREGSQSSSRDRPDRGAKKPGNEGATDSSTSSHPPRPLRLVSFNVERGYELARVVSLLKHLDPDIVALQECDWGCKRSRSADVGREIAKALKFAGAFAAEFEEVDSPARSERDAGGGVHGNAVLCRWGFAAGPGKEGAFSVPHALAYDWEHETERAFPAAAAAAGAGPGRRSLRFLFGPKRRRGGTPASREPRRGGRVALGAACRVPVEMLGLLNEETKEEELKEEEAEGEEREEGEEKEEEEASGDKRGSESGFVVVVAYSLHLECFCGAAGRALQLREVLLDAEERLPKLSRELLLEQSSEPRVSSPPRAPPRSPPPPRLFCSVLGDFNTLAHGIVRLSPLRARGFARWSSLGRTEARWLHRRVLSSRVDDEEVEREDGGSSKERCPPSLFFECPFPLDTVTFDNPSYHFAGGRLRLVRGKLDWALLLKKGKEKSYYGGLRALSATTANEDFSASDHRALVVEVVAEE